MTLREPLEWLKSMGYAASQWSLNSDLDTSSVWGRDHSTQPLSLHFLIWKMGTAVPVHRIILRIERVATSKLSAK